MLRTGVIWKSGWVVGWVTIRSGWLLELLTEPTNLNSVLRAKNFGNSTLFIWNHNSTFFASLCECTTTWLSQFAQSRNEERKWTFWGEISRAKLRAKQSGRETGGENLLGGKDCHQRGESNPTMAPPCETTTWQGYKCASTVPWESKKIPICISTRPSILFCKEPKNIFMYIVDSFVF